MATNKKLVKLGKVKAAVKLQELQNMDPVYSKTSQDDFDPENAFQVFAQLTGDVEKTAHALGLSNG